MLSFVCAILTPVVHSFFNFPEKEKGKENPKEISVDVQLCHMTSKSHEIGLEFSERIYHGCTGTFPGKLGPEECQPGKNGIFLKNAILPSIYFLRPLLYGVNSRELTQSIVLSRCDSNVPLIIFSPLCIILCNLRREFIRTDTSN
jgi:hypothetical protein